MERKESLGSVRPRLVRVVALLSLAAAAGFAMEALSAGQAMHVVTCLASAHPGGCVAGETGGFDF